MILDALFLLFLLFLLLAIALFVQQLRINRRFTRRLRRKPIALQKHRFSPKPQWVIDAIIKLKAFMPSAGVRTIASTFNRIHGKRETVSKSFVAKVILKHRYAIAIQRRDMRNRKPIAMPANATWGLDLCGKQDVVCEVHPILGIVDHGSRLAVLLIAIANMNFYTLAGMC